MINEQHVFQRERRLRPIVRGSIRIWPKRKFFFCCLDGIEISHLSMFVFVFVRFTNKFCVFLSMEFRSLVDCGADLVYVCCS